MAKATNVNIDCSVRQGSQLLFDLKTLLLANGWTITATSDGTNFTNGPAPDNVSTVALFDVSNAYYVLGDPSGTFWLYVQRRAANTTFTVKISRVAPQANGTATVLPTTAVATNERTLINNAVLFNSSVNARGHVITYDAAENAAGVRPFYVLMTDGTATLLGCMVFEAIEDGSYDSSNAYPWVVSAGAGNVALAFAGTTWTYYFSPTNAFVSTVWSFPSIGTNLRLSDATSPWSGQDFAYLIAIGRNAAPASLLGILKHIRFAWFYRNYPNTLTTSAGDRYVYAVNFVIPYEDGATPSGGVSTNYTGFFVLPDTPAPIQYTQRVWSTGTLVWCYYVGAINPTPASTATTPNWVGSATQYQLLGPA